MELNSVVFLRLFSFCFLHAKRAAEYSTALPTYNMIMRKISE